MKAIKNKKIKPFHNQYGYIKIGTPVSFNVENQSMWGGDLKGILEYNKNKNEYFIRTKNSGDLQIDEYLSVYGNTIRPLYDNNN